MIAQSSQSEMNRVGVRRQRSSDIYSTEPDHNHDMVDENNHHNNHMQARPINDDVDENNDDDDDDENDDEYLVSCRCESAKVISTLLSCLRNVATASTGHGGGGGGSRIGNHTSLVSSTQNVSSTYSVRSSRRSHHHSNTASSSSSLQPVTVYCSATNMTFHICSTSKQIQASVDIPANLFSDYSVATTTTSGGTDEGTTTHNNNNNTTGGEFCINLVTLLECLHCLGTQNLETTKLCFSYNTTQELFKLELLEELSGILSTASIPGMLSPYEDEDDDDGMNHIHQNHTNGRRLYSLAHAFRQSEKYVRLIIQSDSLNELMTELDYIAGGTMAQVTLEHDHQALRIRVVGYLGECQIVLPTRGSHIISLEAPDTNEHDVVPPTWTYPLHAFMESMRGLEIADETCITINMAGMMAIQHQVIQHDQQTTEDVAPSFVDFILCCMVEDDNDDDEEEEEDDHVRNPTTVIHSDGRIQNDRGVATTRPTKRNTTSRARIVSQTKPSYLDDNDNNNNSDSDSDNVPNDTASGSKSHITPLSASGARLFGSLAMEDDHDDDDDDDDDESPPFEDAAVSSRKGRPAVSQGQHRQRPVEASVTIQPHPHDVKKKQKSRSLKPSKAPEVIATRGIRASTRRGKVATTKKQSRFNDSDSNNDDDDSDADDDDDMEVAALALSGLASTVAAVASSSRHGRRGPSRNHRRTTRRTIHDDEEVMVVHHHHQEEDDDGSSSPELVYGQQH